MQSFGIDLKRELRQPPEVATSEVWVPHVFLRTLLILLLNYGFSNTCVCVCVWCLVADSRFLFLPLFSEDYWSYYDFFL